MMIFRFRWRYMVLVWLVVSVPMLWFHFAVGQKILETESARIAINVAGNLYQDSQYKAAEERLLDAEKLIPKDDDTLNAEYKIRLALVKLKQGKLTEASELIVQTADHYPDLPSALDLEVREAMGTALYYRAWFQRISGVGRKKWEPNAVKARQNFRYLAEKSGNEADLQNLERAVTLSRMDLDQLYEFPLPEELEKAKKEECESNDPGDQSPQEGEDDGDKEKDGNKKDGGRKPGPKKRPGRQPAKDIRDQEGPQKQGAIGSPDLSGS